MGNYPLVLNSFRKMKVFIKKMIDPWAGVAYYNRGRYHMVGSYLTRTGLRYTGLDSEQRERIASETGLPLNMKEYWENFGIKIGPKGLELNTEDAFDEMRYIFLKNHKHVKYGYSDQTKPNASYVMINRDQEAEEKNEYNKVKRNALIEVGKMSLNDMIKCLRLFGVKADNVTPAVVESKVSEIADTQSQKFLDLWVNNKNKEIEYIIKEAIAKNTLRRERSVYYYGSDVIGRSLPETVAYMKDKNNSDIKMAILDEIEYKK